MAGPFCFWMRHILRSQFGRGNAPCDVGQLPPNFSQRAIGQGGVFVRLHDLKLSLDELEAVMQYRLQDHMERTMRDRRSDQHLVRGQSVRPSQTEARICQRRAAGQACLIDARCAGIFNRLPEAGLAAWRRHAGQSTRRSLQCCPDTQRGRRTNVLSSGPRVMATVDGY